jgi:hypothetical protein
LPNGSFVIEERRKDASSPFGTRALLGSRT